MGEIIRFAPKSERERARLVREARAIYDSVFPPSEFACDQSDNACSSHMRVGADIDRGDGGVS
ncbi:hypothetical protein [Bradyrhizobium sp. CB1015]|uniref:hypothetical protein n=1 Tax=Bradyrhizobium sp. CB1015 TaxID=2976822 RepID=UPI0021A9B5C1|nr:hypothetical protein [Bradyrhizobium sp. CB1015]UWU94379.1 hypothetical protein N2604_11295 [Bradyrhizobium sp. CB1015]